MAQTNDNTTSVQKLVQERAQQTQTIEQQRAEIEELRSQLEKLKRDSTMYTLPNGDLYRPLPSAPRDPNIELSKLDIARMTMNWIRNFGFNPFTQEIVDVGGGQRDGGYTAALEAALADSRSSAGPRSTEAQAALDAAVEAARTAE